jgi:electron transfer flavoprotein alpha subunit
MAMNIEEYKGVWVFIEQIEGNIVGVSLELLGAGRILADKLNVELCGVLLGHNVKDLCPQLFEYGADKVYVIDDSVLEQYRSETYMVAVGDLVRKYKPEIFLYGATANGKDLASAVATEVMTGLTADTTMLDINLEKRLFEASRPAFGGNIMATILCKKHRPQMATVRSKVMKALEPVAGRTGEVIEEKIQIKEENLRTKVLKIVRDTSKAVDLADAVIIVAAGKGVKDAAGLKLISDLADVLNATVGASRDVVEAGLIGHANQVGQTGETVTPKLYFAIGISGAIQHVVGMNSSETIIAINKDPEAQIFNTAHHGIVGDLFEIVPMLTEEFKAALKEVGGVKANA